MQCFGVFLGGRRGAEKGFAIYKGNVDFIGDSNLIPAGNKTGVADVSGILPKGTELGTVPSFVHRWDFLFNVLIETGVGLYP